MNATEQQTRTANRHLVTPRVLIFLTRGRDRAQEVLLLKGAPDKRLWANRYNGLGGHVEATEDVYAAARREVQEEAGIAVDGLALRGVVTIDTQRCAGAATRRADVCLYRRDGMLTPVDGKVAWLLPEGKRSYGEATSLPWITSLYSEGAQGGGRRAGHCWQCRLPRV
jgi:8-oxo-dGTP pyrophosphatase MutT (NUDIX family)